jgi:hypothetical protein
MYLQLDLTAAHGARRKLLEMRFADGGPMRRARSTERMLAFGSIDEMANDGHKKSRSRRLSWVNRVVAAVSVVPARAASPL